MSPGTAGPPPAFPRLTLGVEEEFLLVDPETGRVVPAAPTVRRRIGVPLAERVQPEFTRFQIETNSLAHTDLRRLCHDLAELRTSVAEAAERAGARLVASGTALLGNTGLPPLTPSPRYERMARRYGALLYGQGVCGCHVHIGIGDRDEAVQVSDHVRPWLPVLQALTANSPIMEGADTGYASWRAVLWARWPSAGPPPRFSSAERYDALVEALLEAGAVLDRGMIYWYVRPSHHLPTLEFRGADTCATVGETVALAGLVRALAATALADVRRGLPPPEVDQTLLEAAYWRAARDGLEGDGLDLATGRRTPMWKLVGALLRWVRSALEESGDLPLVTELLNRLHRRGSGAARQRAAYRPRHDVRDVARLLAAQTRDVSEFPVPARVAAEPPAMAPGR
ncbi:carboxylate-amine ligase [Planomonospora venezuelensis]|uniref:Putative glutamate--cysteine ligase 2 n=1 Tax=Planomonospora venezuelensis TaxID=1999 RepID=A0A841D904_PLAVE|nr:glutamate--cysteine ligase [Planomonospora venezuelensis]MBB5967112.1 carboxylate-amine ligase [Planomonospora venezuelensis]GIN04843.1 putative glutamate--cysteine ligase 2-3 [Planomonospora venezuelensis]